MLGADAIFEDSIIRAACQYVLTTTPRVSAGVNFPRKRTGVREEANSERHHNNKARTMLKCRPSRITTNPRYLEAKKTDAAVETLSVVPDEGR